MRTDEEFLQQVAMQEIVCPCGEDCLDQKGVWQHEPKEKASKKTGNPMISKHNTLAGLHECIACRVLALHERWLKNPAVRIKLSTVVTGPGGLTGVDAYIGMHARSALTIAFERAVERLKFYRYSQPSEIDEAASTFFGSLWHEVIARLKVQA